METVAPGPALTLATLVGGVAALLAAAGLAWISRGLARALSLPALCVGGALLALPWLARPAPEPPPAPAPVIEGSLALSGDGRRIVTLAPPTPPPPLPGREATEIAIEAIETEPNDTIAGANLAALGASILGWVDEGDTDTFAFDVGNSRRDAVVATIVTRDASAAIVLLDDAARPLGSARTIDEIRVRTASLERPLNAGRYYVQVIGLTPAPAAYELVLTAERR